MPDNLCPLVTDLTSAMGLNPELLGKLHALRKWVPATDGEVPFKWPPLLRTTKRSTGEPIRLREYQKVAAHHLVHMPRFILGDAVGLGKTIDCIAAACYVRDRFPDAKVLVLATKSATFQWASEFEDFSEMRPYVMRDTFSGLKSHEARRAQLEAFMASDKVDVMVAKYSSLIGRRKVAKGKWDAQGNPTQPGKPEAISQEVKEYCKLLRPHADHIILILDEGHKFMHYNQTRKLVLNLVKHAANYVWVLTATAIKNQLDEFYGIASAIGVRPFGYAQDFRERFCIYREIYIGGGRRKAVIVGYKNIPEFKAVMRPWFLGRSQKQVNEPLPALLTVYHPMDLDDEQSDLLLNQIPSGEFVLPPKIIEVEGQLVEKGRDTDNIFTMLSVYQLVANHPCLLDPDDKAAFYTKSLSPKEEALLDMLDGDFAGEKVIVYTKFLRWIDRLEKITADGHFTSRKFLRITGKESDRKREENKQLFQDPDSGYDTIFINAAGMESINLQSAAHTILLDCPWSWGDLIQLVGRMVRMASPHSMCTLHVMVARGTPDEYTIETLKGKKGIFEAILGESHSAGILDDKSIFDLSAGMDTMGSDEEFRRLLVAHAKKHGLTKFTSGERLSKAMGSDKYQMTFEQKPRKPQGFNANEREMLGLPRGGTP